MTKKERRDIEQQIAWHEQLLELEGTALKAEVRTELQSEIAKRKAALAANPQEG